jgi:hypothetical protein
MKGKTQNIKLNSFVAKKTGRFTAIAKKTAQSINHIEA